MPKPFSLKPVKPTEHQIQDAILRYLARERRVLWAERMNSGKGLVVRPNGSTQWMKWGFVGCPDIMGQLKDGRYLAIECKSHSGRVRPEQRQHITQAADHGAVAIIARSVEDVQTALDAATATHASPIPARCACVAYNTAPGDVIATALPNSTGELA
jgi:hypothetical protein